MTTAEVLILEGPGRLRAETLPIPCPGPREAVLSVEACGLCGTDHELFSGTMAARTPLIPGHEIVGTIQQAGDDYLEERRLDIGARVAVEVFQTCHRCEPCSEGTYPLCRNHGLDDSYGNTPLARAPGLWGGYATHLFLTADSVVHRVPAGLDPIIATLFNPLGAGVRWGATLPGVRTGDVVAVLGPGLRGLAAVSAAVAAGASFVLLTGSGSADGDRLKTGISLGASAVVDITTADARTVLKEATGGLADVVVDVTAAAPAAFLQAIDLARPGGTIVVAGTRGARVLEAFNPDRIVFKELRLLGARGVDGAAYRRALALLASDDRLSRVSRRIVPLEPTAVAQLLDQMAKGYDRPLHAVVAIQR